MDYPSDMLRFDFTKSGVEFIAPFLLNYKTFVENVINNVKSGENEYVFSTILDSNEEIKKIKNIVRLIKKKFDILIVAGIGGSSLGARTLINGLSEKSKKGIRVIFLENIDPDTISRVLSDISPSKTAVNIISRSGSTLETVSQYLILKEFFKKKLKEKFNKNFFVTTANENSFLGKEAKAYSFSLIKVPPDLVGRYSVLSPVGLIPAGAGGLDIEKIVDGAKKVRELCLDPDLSKNPAVQFSAVCYHHYLMGRKTIVIMPYRDALFTFGEWFAQLWAESLGKADSDGTPQGQTPVRGIGTQDQHSLLQLYLDGPDDKLVIFVTSNPDKDIVLKEAPDDFLYLKNKRLSTVLISEQKATQDALFAKGRPSIGVHLDKLDETSLGELFYFFEVTTLFMASFLKVNPFNQPAVEDIKKRAKEILAS